MGKDEEGYHFWTAEMRAIAHRQMCQTTLHALGKEFGREKAIQFSRSAGTFAGNDFAHAFLDLTADFRTFVLSLQKALTALKVDTLRVELLNPDSGNLAITTEDCHGCDDFLAAQENIRIYDEGFVAGILEVYTGKRHNDGEA